MNTLKHTALAANLKRLKKEHKIKTWEIAEHLHTSKSTVDDYLYMGLIPRMPRLIKLAELFDCTLDDLFRVNE